LTATPTNLSGQLRLSWLAPASNGGAAVVDYVIQRSPNGTSSWVTINDGVRPITTFTVTGLANGTRYYFRLFARNAAGTSGASNVANAIPRAVPSAPRSLTAVLAGPGSVRLSWLAPTSSGGSPVTDYVIQRSTNGTTGWVTINDGVRTTTAHQVTGLTNGTRYYFRVLARNAAGSSAASNITNLIPRPVPTAPRNLTAGPTNRSGQIRLVWLAPATNGGSPVTDYVVQRSPSGTSGWVTINDGVRTTTSFTVTGLTNGVRHYFRVIARNAAGFGPASNVANAIPRTTPTAPRLMTATPTNASGQLRVQWLPPASNGGSPVTVYVVQVSLDGATGWMTLNGGTTTSTFGTVTGLANGRRYYFRVFAWNAAGRSPASNVANAIPRTVPGMPTALRVTASFEGYLMRWTAPSSGGAPITDYVVQVYDSELRLWWTYNDGVSTSPSAFVALSGFGCDLLRVAARNAAGVGLFTPPVESCFL
jgi:titin